MVQPGLDRVVRQGAKLELDFSHGLARNQHILRHHCVFHLAYNFLQWVNRVLSFRLFLSLGL